MRRSRRLLAAGAAAAVLAALVLSLAQAQGTSFGVPSYIAKPMTFSREIVIDGTTDAKQLYVQGHSTQTNNLLELDNYLTQDIFTVNNDGTTAWSFRLSGSFVQLNAAGGPGSSRANGIITRSWPTRRASRALRTSSAT